MIFCIYEHGQTFEIEDIFLIGVYMWFYVGQYFGYNWVLDPLYSSGKVTGG